MKCAPSRPPVLSRTLPILCSLLTGAGLGPCYAAERGGPSRFHQIDKQAAPLDQPPNERRPSALVDQLRHGGPAERDAAEGQLRAMGPAATAALVEVLQSEDVLDVRLRAARALSSTSCEVLHAVASLYRREDGGTRSVAEHAMRRLSDCVPRITTSFSVNAAPQYRESPSPRMACPS